jgi:glutamyl-tRNA reductase
MHPVVLGISHKTAPLELRERLALPCDDAARLARELLDCETVAEAVVLSTCNRTEVYLLAADVPAAQRLAAARLAARGGVAPAALAGASCAASDEAAIAHLFRVAASLDSLVVGEAQVMAQLKDAYEAARAEGCTGAVFNRLFRQALEVGKRVRTETTIGRRPVSVSSVAVDLARQELGTLDDRVVLVLGAGETGELTVKHLKAQGAGAVVVANRTLAAAQAVAARCDGRAACLDALDAELLGADIVISSTSAPGFLVDRDRLASVMRARRRRPMFLIDIAVPRNLDPGIGRLEDCCLYDIDDLRGVVAANRYEREREVVQADRIVAEEVVRMSDWLAGLEVVPTIARLRGAVDAVRDAELARLESRLAGLTPELRAEVEQLTAAVVNKILHVPTVRLKELAAECDAYVYVDALQRLFDLTDTAPAPACERERSAAGRGAPGERLVALDGGGQTESPAALTGANRAALPPVARGLVAGLGAAEPEGGGPAPVERPARTALGGGPTGR